MIFERIRWIFLGHRFRCRPDLGYCWNGCPRFTEIQRAIYGPGKTFSIPVRDRCTATCGHTIYAGAYGISAPNGLFCSPDCAEEQT